MKRSEINEIIANALTFLSEMKFALPVWAYWSPEDWRTAARDAGEIFECGLGWDVTDMGSGSFHNVGLTLFTVRNGVLGTTQKQYCEKVMIVEEEQITPLHTHNLKTEDIINRGGGKLVLELFQADDGGGLSDREVRVGIDSLPVRVPAGGKVILEPGQSICLIPGVYHKFYGQSGAGTVLVGEVSSVNDDKTDNVFYEGMGRFPRIEEDTPPEHLMVGDYQHFL